MLQLWLVATARRLAPAGKQRSGGRVCTWAHRTEAACSICARLAQGGCKGCEPCDSHIVLGCPAWSGRPFPAKDTGCAGLSLARSLTGMPRVGHGGDSHQEGPPGNGLLCVLLPAALCPGKEVPGSGTCYLWFPTVMRLPHQHGSCGAGGSWAVCSPCLRHNVFGEPAPSPPHRAHRGAAAAAAGWAGAHFHSQGLLPASSAWWVCLSPLTSPACWPPCPPALAPRASPGMLVEPEAEPPGGAGWLGSRRFERRRRLPGWAQHCPGHGDQWG